MSELDDKVKAAIKAYKAKKRSEAREILMEVVDRDEKHEQGWLYLSLVVDSKQEQQICLENVLAINPNNQQARKALEVLNQKLGAPPPPPPPKTPSTTPPVISGFGGQSSGRGFDDSGTISSWGDIDTSSTPSSGGFEDQPANSPPSPITPSTPAANNAGWFDDMDSPWQTSANDPATSGSLDFGGMSSASTAGSSSTPSPTPSQSADTGYSYGRSGVDTGDEFSSNELDSWISQMGIGSGEDGTAPPQVSPAAGGDLFGSGSSSTISDPFGDAASGGPSDTASAVSGSAFDSFDWGSAAKSESDDDGLSGFGGWDDDLGSVSSAPTSTAPSTGGGTVGDLGSGWDSIGSGDSFGSSPFDGSGFEDAPASSTSSLSGFNAPAQSNTSGSGSLGFLDDDDDDDDVSSIFPSGDRDGTLRLFDDDDDDDESMEAILGEKQDLSDIDGLDESGEIKIDRAALQFFAQIPDEIKVIEEASVNAKKERSGGIGALLSTLLLLLLNIGLAAGAFVQFSNM